jgi:DNA-binding LacI/PurR family transcriptional regulator
LDAIEALGFSPNVAARQLSGGKTWTVGVLTPFFTNPSFVQRLSGIQDVLDDSNYDLVLYSIRTHEQLKRRLSEIATSSRVDGLIILTLHPTPDDLPLGHKHLPVLLVIEEPDNYFPHIMVNNPAGGRMATEFLMERDHTQIGFVGDELENSLHLRATQHRFTGFRAAMNDAGLPIVGEWCQFGVHSQQSAFEHAHAMLSERDRPTAIVASSDTMAFGVIEAANALRLRIPQDLAVIGFDDIPAAKIIQLTTVRQPLFRSGQLAAERLFDYMAAGDIQADKLSTELPLEIVNRETV